MFLFLQVFFGIPSWILPFQFFSWRWGPFHPPFSPFNDLTQILKSLKPILRHHGMYALSLHTSPDQLAFFRFFFLPSMDQTVCCWSGAGVPALATVPRVSRYLLPFLVPPIYSHPFLPAPYYLNYTGSHPFLLPFSRGPEGQAWQSWFFFQGLDPGGVLFSCPGWDNNCLPFSSPPR